LICLQLLRRLETVNYAYYNLDRLVALEVPSAYLEDPVIDIR